MVKKYDDIISGGVLFTVACILFYSSFGIRQMTDSRIGSAFLPQVVSISIAILSAVLLINGIKKLKSKGVEIDEDGTSKGVKGKYTKVVQTILILFIYILLLRFVGFIIMTTLYLISNFYIYSPHKKKNIVLFILIALVTSLCIYFIFSTLFSIRLPVGFLG